MPKYKITKNGEGIIPQGEISIEHSAFKKCKRLTSIIIPDSVFHIGSEAFAGCVNLKEITIPDSVEYIDFHAFAECKELTAIVIPASVKRLGTYLFTECDKLSSIVVAEGNKQYDSRNNCNAIIDTESNTLLHGCANTVIPDSVTAIGPGAFTRHPGITAISIPGSVKSIGNAAFFACENLDNVTIPDSVETIGQEAFARCKSLKTITIPKGANVAKDAFEHTPCLKNNKSEEKRTAVTFSYAGQLDFHIEGECTIEVTAKEQAIFKHINQQAKEEKAGDIMAYFEEHMPQALYDDIYTAISHQIQYHDAEEMIEHEGRECFENMSKKTFDSMTKEELIERYMDENCDGLYEFLIENIEIKEC